MVAHCGRRGGPISLGWIPISPLSPGVQSWYVAGNLFNSLLTIDGELNYVPELAESWDILENGQVYVFHLRQGVKFIDGADFDAEVVRWNYQRILDPPAPLRYSPDRQRMPTACRGGSTPTGPFTEPRRALLTQDFGVHPAPREARPDSAEWSPEGPRQRIWLACRRG
jgi:ABC-type transport system substrate-binding protein